MTWKATLCVMLLHLSSLCAAGGKKGKAADSKGKGHGDENQEDFPPDDVSWWNGRCLVSECMQ